MKAAWIHILFALVLGLVASPSKSQVTGASARLDNDALMIGDQTKLELTVTVPAGSQLLWPVFTDTLTRSIEILRKSALDTVSSNSEVYTLRQEILVTSFDSGSYVIPPIQFKYRKKGDTVVYFTETRPVRLAVNTVQTDDKQDIKPIKPPLTAPVTLAEILKWAGLAFLVAAIAFAIYYFLFRKKKQEPVMKMRLKPTIPPDEAAIEALETLKMKKLWQAGRIKEYYSELTDIVREYIELRFPVRALEMTTGEIEAALRQTAIQEGTREKLGQTLTLADLVKFAKEQPLPSENEQSMSQCVEFVRETRPVKEPASPMTDAKENRNHKISET